LHKSDHAPGGPLQHLQQDGADKLLIDLDALLHQTLDHPFCRGVRAETMEGAPDRSFFADRAQAAMLPTNRPPACCRPCFFIRPGLRYRPTELRLPNRTRSGPLALRTAAQALHCNRLLLQKVLPGGGRACAGRHCPLKREFLTGLSHKNPLRSQEKELP
jgi:hypothetical protein